jgi:putative flippase GtrA
MELLRKHAEKIRFAIVGGANTVLDFALLFIFVSLGVDRIVSNYFSTGIAFVFSFFVNKSFTFNNKGGNVAKQFALFIGVTIIGLWVIQPLIILGVSPLFEGFGWNDAIVLFIAKLIATIASLIWNYILYSRLVFTKTGK